MLRSLVPPNPRIFTDETAAALFFFQDSWSQKKPSSLLAETYFFDGLLIPPCPREEQPRRKAHLKDVCLNTGLAVRNVL